MWQSEDDVLRDIASLNDFETPGNKEPHRILYSVGRGLKTKEKPKISDKFIDSRTGEVLNLEDAVLGTNSTLCKGRGRGSILGSFFRTKLQLQQQLRLARPHGSSDEAVESYYGKNKAVQKPEKSISIPVSENTTQSPRVPAESHNTNLNPNEIRKRVKATRNSSLQVNALINSLLCKTKIDSDLTTKQNFTSNTENKQLNFSTNTIKFNVPDKKEASDLNVSDLPSCNNLKKNVNLIKKNTDDCKESTKCIKSPNVGDVNFKIIDDDEEEEEYNHHEIESMKKQDESKEKVKNDSYFKTDVLELGNNQNEEYKAHREGLNKLREDYTETVESGRYDLTSFNGYCVHTEPVIFTDEDFPPLQKN